MALTTSSRVYHRSGLSEKDVPSSEVDEFIEDAQAFIEGRAERTFEAADSDYNLARAACTDLAAAYALIRILGGSYSGLQFSEEELNISAQQQSKRELVNTLLSRANKALDILKPSSASLMPRSSTFV